MRLLAVVRVVESNMLVFDPLDEMTAGAHAPTNGTNRETNAFRTLHTCS
jgi:hypothetical protein